MHNTDATMDEAREACTKAADYISEHGWCQDDWEDDQGRVCAEGALRRVTGAHEEVKLDYTTLFTARSLMRQHLDETGQGHYASVPHWNDDPDRTAEDVILAFKTVGAGE